MPDVTGEKLDVAYEAIADAGLDDKDKVQVDGGGMFGVVKESNWTVCEQTPAAGEPMPDEPSLKVDRSCDEEEDASSEDPTEQPEDEPSETPSESTSETASESPEPSDTPSGSPSETPTPTEPSDAPTPEPPAVLTAENTPAFAEILALGDNCAPKIAAFAKAYAGQTVQFPGAIVNVAPHGSYSTRFDFLVSPGDFDPNSAQGPTFQLRDKNAFDLNLTGKKIPKAVRAGQNYTFVAELGAYSPKTCLFQLEPIETRTR